MYIIEAHGDSRSWISGIFEEEYKAKEYFTSISPDLKKIQDIIRIQMNFPFYVIEVDRSFKYLSREEMLQELINIEEIEDSNHVYFNLYLIKSDYFPDRPGTDYMGILNHDHIDNFFLEWYRKEGEEFLKRRRILAGKFEEDSNIS